MLTRKSSLAARSKMLVFVPVALVCFFCFSKNSFSQKTTAERINVIPFGISDTAIMYTVTYDQILASPTIVCNNASCKQVSFTIGFMPNKQDYWGPFKTDGTTKIGQKQIDFVKKMKEDNVKETRIFIENIQVSCDGEIINLRPKLFKATL